MAQRARQRAAKQVTLRDEPDELLVFVEDQRSVRGLTA
jgi:hypothetical protein